jgi:hypothetical protein
MRHLFNISIYFVDLTTEYELHMNKFEYILLQVFDHHMSWSFLCSMIWDEMKVEFLTITIC